MKKFITLMLVLCCTFFVVGCGDNLSETYWEDTSKVLTEYFESEKFQQVSNLTFNDNLNILIRLWLKICRTCKCLQTIV